MGKLSDGLDPLNALAPRSAGVSGMPMVTVTIEEHDALRLLEWAKGSTPRKDHDGNIRHDPHWERIAEALLEALTP